MAAHRPHTCVYVGFETGAAPLDSDGDEQEDRCFADGPGSVCPACRRLAYLDLQYTDYVERPMLWCDGCGARYVLDASLAELEALEGAIVAPGSEANEAVAAPPRAEWVEQAEVAGLLASGAEPVAGPEGLEACRCGARPCLNRRWLRIPCLWVTRVIPSNLSGVALTRDLDAGELREALAGAPREAADRLRAAGLAEPEETDEPDWRLSLECGSFDVLAPAVGYPPGADFAHDGIHVYVECELASGALERLSYWGD